MPKIDSKIAFSVALIFLSQIITIFAQPEKERGRVRPVTIPISIYTKQELRERQAEEFLEAGDIIVRENGELQPILSIRSVSNTPLALAVLIQDDLSSNFNLELKGIADFIRRLPRGSRVMVGYLRNSLEVRQKFTEDLTKAADSLRIVAGSAAGGTNPYDGVLSALKRFDALPTGRRAVLLVSDGLDVSEDLRFASPASSIELDRAISNAQRKGIAIYSFYSTTRLTETGNDLARLNGQGSLNKLSEETGGRAFFQGAFSPVSFQPFFGELNLLLNRQFALTYLSNHMKKGYYKVQVNSTLPEIKIDHPKGYYYR